MKLKHVIFALLILLALGISLAIHFESPPVNLQVLDAIPVGATKAEVLQAIGAPSGRHNGDTEWSYSRFLAWPIVYVMFDENGQYVEYVYDR